MARSNQRGEFKGRGQDRVRLPQPAMRQLQPMPVAPPAMRQLQPMPVAPQQGGGMFSGVMNPVTRPVVGNNMPINNVNPQVGMGMPSPPQQGGNFFNLGNGMNQTEYRPTDDRARGPTVDQLNHYLNTSYNPPVTLTEPNQQPIAAEAPDLSGYARLDDIPSFNMPDLSGFATLEDLNQGIGGINIPGAPDLSGYARLEDIPSIDTSQFLTAGDLPTAFDDRALRDRIGAIEDRYSTGFDELNRNIGNIPSFDDSTLRDRLQALEGREIPQFDPSGLQSGISGLRDRLDNLNIPEYKAPVNQNGVVMPTNTNAGITGINNPVPGQINPVMTQVDRGERISDSNLREAYFGSPDTPGIINTAYEAAQKSYLDNPAIGKQVAGLSPLEMEAMQGAYSGIGSYQPYLDAQQSGILEGLGMSRRAGQIAQPYFAGQEQYLGGATEQARQAAGMQFDPSTMTQAYFDPFEDRVVQQTMDDVFKQGDIADVAQRARDIQSGGESAFGSRARLTADERRSSLGRGLGEALARIRSSGFQNAQSSAMGEFGRQQQARERYGDTLSQFGNQLGGIGATRSALTRGIGSDISGYGGQIGGLGSTQYGLGARQRDELAGLGSVARGVSQAGLDSDYNRRMEDRMAPVTAATYARGFLPAYQPGFTDVQKEYRMPRDPLASGISTMLGTYGSLQNTGQPNQNPYTNAYNQYASQQGFDPSGNYS